MTQQPGSSPDVSNDQPTTARVALVTGGTSGIGAAIAERLRRDGLRVAITGRTASAAESSDPDLLVLKYDITDEGAPENIVQDVIDRFGRLDVLVNNAGRRHLGLIVDTPVKDIVDVFHVNTFAAMAMTAAAAKVMAAQREGTVVNMISRLATIGVATLSTYSASKGALLAYTRAAAVELAPYNIRVNAVAPGMTSTPLIDSWAADHADPEKALNDVVDAVPLGRLATTEDVAGAVSYLASLDARYITGISLPVDGGYTAQ